MYGQHFELEGIGDRVAQLARAHPGAVGVEVDDTVRHHTTLWLTLEGERYEPLARGDRKVVQRDARIANLALRKTFKQ